MGSKYHTLMACAWAFVSSVFWSGMILNSIVCVFGFGPIQFGFAVTVMDAPGTHDTNLYGPLVTVGSWLKEAVFTSFGFMLPNTLAGRIPGNELASALSMNAGSGCFR